ncbi:CcmD family protein [Sulfidibacter corallicola]|uniref:CcmD family protein n=1 Tax=Sulfidibacter corallicola TaxID=2818388 RepID=A0A8A4TSU5_SULCO|nr:CcmD family protein [Sulfidibacter corallicola]QTD52234.1 CcmD family protein [Sulfidibacter corallicola]
MSYLVAAYSVVWVVVSIYIFTLIRRNRDLDKTVETLEARIARLESEGLDRTE